MLPVENTGFINMMIALGHPILLALPPDRPQLVNRRRRQVSVRGECFQIRLIEGRPQDRVALVLRHLACEAKNEALNLDARVVTEDLRRSLGYELSAFQEHRDSGRRLPLRKPILEIAQPPHRCREQQRAEFFKLLTDLGPIRECFEESLDLRGR